jgi:hypothetical protein
MPQPIEKRTKLDGSGTPEIAGTPLTGVVKVRMKLGSKGLVASIPMQYWPAGRLDIEIVPVKLSPPSNVALALLQLPAAPSENRYDAPGETPVTEAVALNGPPTQLNK